MGGTTEAYRWAVSVAKRESAYGTQVPDNDLTKWFEVKDADFAKITKERRTNQQYINGVRGYNTFQVHSQTGMLRRRLDLSAELFTFLLAMQLGNYTASGAEDPYTHAVKHPSICTLFPNSFSLIEGIICSGLTGTQKLYKGCVVDKQEININGKLEIDHTVDIKTDGSETAKAAFSPPSSVEAVNYLLGNMCTLKLNPYAASDITISGDQFKSMKLTISSNLEVVKTINSGLYVPKYKFKKDSPKMDIEIVVAADKSDVIYGYYTSEERLQLQLTIEPGLTPARTISLDVPECFIEDCEQGAEDIEPTLKLKIEGLDLIANSGPALWSCKTGVAAYLTT